MGQIAPRVPSGKWPESAAGPGCWEPPASRSQAHRYGPTEEPGGCANAMAGESAGACPHEVANWERACNRNPADWCQSEGELSSTDGQAPRTSGHAVHKTSRGTSWERSPEIAPGMCSAEPSSRVGRSSRTRRLRRPPKLSPRSFRSPWSLRKWAHQHASQFRKPGEGRRHMLSQFESIVASDLPLRVWLGETGVPESRAGSPRSKHHGPL